MKTCESMTCKLAVLALHLFCGLLPSGFFLTLFGCCSVPAGQALAGLVCVSAANRRIPSLVAFTRLLGTQVLGMAQLLYA